MSVSVSRSDEVTVLTLTSDQSSVCPPFCQLLGALCYTPACCSKKRRLTPHRLGAQTVLGALWIITALLHIGLGLILLTTRGAPVFMLESTYCPVWLGVLFLLFGVCALLTEKHPRPIFVLLSGILNLGGVALSITAIVWYGTEVDNPGYWSFCHRDGYSYDYYDWNTPPTTTMSPEQSTLLQRCVVARELLRVLTTSVQSVLVALSCLDLCVGLSSSIISFKTLKHGQPATASDNEPLLKEDKE